MPSQCKSTLNPVQYVKYNPTIVVDPVSSPLVRATAYLECFDECLPNTMFAQKIRVVEIGAIVEEYNLCNATCDVDEFYLSDETTYKYECLTTDECDSRLFYEDRFEPNDVT